MTTFGLDLLGVNWRGRVSLTQSFLGGGWVKEVPYATHSMFADLASACLPREPNHLKGPLLDLPARWSAYDSLYQLPGLLFRDLRLHGMSPDGGY